MELTHFDHEACLVPFGCVCASLVFDSYVIPVINYRSYLPQEYLRLVNGSYLPHEYLHLVGR